MLNQKTFLKPRKTYRERHNMSEKNLVYPMCAARWQTQYFVFKPKSCSPVAPEGVGRWGETRVHQSYEMNTFI